ncbi:alpha/beta fold hydrolase [Altererythrobacter salegens]|uniref:Alpha/beta fold hydrolase n=1 Tax=Croceibacterium salegens TaxID=1737568 RepID=A0A6I4SV86_9SPHN|nr:alpha/beta fold hydrolase [Croceibacterium salegens]MXO59418.1 alpha/beta fold hydrolase [Croceibacterium salegens]
MRLDDYNEDRARRAGELSGPTLRDMIERRVELLGREAPEDARSPALKRLFGEIAELAEPVRRAFQPPLEVSPARHRRVVILLPGFGTHPVRMRYMARQLERAGHKVKRWGLGFNLGVSPDMFEALAERVLSVRDRYGQPVVLVGWSLGGVIARELAKRHPDAVAKVITMGSPFSGTPYDNNAWRIYHLITGHAVDRPPVEAQLSVKPPVETVALWSPRDGIVSPRASCGKPGERDRAIAIRCNHVGFPNAPECIRTVLRELDDA